MSKNRQELQIKVAKSAGFCPGVRLAVETAYELAEQEGFGNKMYGEIVHNAYVVDSLLEKGFTLVENPSVVQSGDRVIIRAHGITLEEMQALQQKGAEICDCTCVWVKHIHKLAERCKEEDKDFILCGDPQHPEVRGIVSHYREGTKVISSVEEAKQISKSHKATVIAAQTTFAVAQFLEIVNILKNRLINLEIFDTICRTTASRQEEAAELAKTSDLVFVLGGKNSSNTAKLLRICQDFCSETYSIQRPEQIYPLLKGRNLGQMRIGITAGASTPERMIREVIHVMTGNQTFSEETENKAMPEEVEEQQNLDKAEESGVEAPTAQTVEETEEQVAYSSEVDEESAAAEEYFSSNDDDEYEDDGDDEFSFSDYIDGIPQLKRGAIITGTIVRYDDEFVYVDVKDKSEGKVPRHEFVDDPDFNLQEAAENHDEVEVYVRNIKNTDMGKEITLSKARVDFEKHKDVIKQAFEEQTPMTVKVNNVVKDGVIASYGSVDLYIHRTQLELRRVDDLEPYRGKTLKVLITQFDPNRRRLRVSGSRRALLQRERKELAKEVWDNIEVGKIYEGKVRSLTNFGAFVDIGGVDGLVHISELSWNRIKHPSDVVAVGDYLEVFVLDFDMEKDRISLGYRRPENDPYNAIEERFPQGSIVRGIVVRMFPFGAFVEIAPGVDALCHISQISNYHLNHPEDVLQVGMEVDARVMAVSDKERKISISIKEVEAIDPSNPEDFIEHKTRAPRNNEDGEERKPRRRRPQNEERKPEPTTYTDSSSGSSFASLANVTVSSKEGQEFLESLKEEEAAEEVVEEVVEEPANEIAEEAENEVEAEPEA